MCQLYLTQQGSKIRRKGKRLVVEKDNEELFSVPLHRVDRVIMMGRMQLTASAMALLLDRQIPLVLTTIRGRLRGTLSPPLNPAVHLRKSQYRLSEDKNYCLRFALDLVKARAL